MVKRESIVVVVAWATLAVLTTTGNAVHGVEYPCRFGVGNQNAAWLHQDGSLRFPSYATGALESGGKVGSRERRDKYFFTNPCQFSRNTRQLACKETIDFYFLRIIQNEEIESFVVDSYNSKLLSRRRRTRFRTCKQRVMGELQLRDINVELRTTVDVRGVAANKLSLSGEIFSNKIIKMGYKYKGSSKFYADGDELMAKVDLSSSEARNGWKLSATMRFSKSSGTFSGRFAQSVKEPLRLDFAGVLLANATDGEDRLTGWVKMNGINMIGDLCCRLTKCLSTDITIPERAFSNMSIKNLIFENSNFIGDFDSHSLEGIKDLQTITFAKSTMEFMPDYDQLFRNPSLKAIYIEESNTPTIATGTRCTMENLELLSFAGSGFLEFSNTSFNWLSCSNLTYLNFHDANFKLIGNGSILEPVKDTLTHLDLSYTPLAHESSLLRVVNGTGITHLSLAGLQLKRVPEAALKAVKGTLRYLTLRKNNFEKVPGENMLATVLSFPRMPALAELDLQECQINYVEKGAFDPLASLSKLDISRNAILNLENGWAASVPKIAYLDLSYNGMIRSRSSGIKMLDSEVSLDLAKFDDLETLDLSNSNFGNAQRLLFNSANDIRYLSLCNCGLRNVSESTFETLRNLIELDLSGNPYAEKTVSLEPLVRISSLRTLHLTCSGIVNVTFGGDDDASGPATNLEYIDLSNNYLKVLGPEFFRRLSNLKTLKLSRNSISMWSNDFLTLNPRLRSIYLDNNKIDELKEEAIVAVGRLDDITLGSNPFACGCFVLEFLGKLLKTPFGHYICPDFVVDHPEFLDYLRRRTRKAIAPHIRGEVKNATHAGATRKVYRYEQECVLVSDWSDSEYQCYSRSLGKTVPFVDVDENLVDCDVRFPKEEIDWAYVALSVTASFSFLWWKWWNFRLFVKMLRGAAVFGTSSETGERDSFNYDAFVSYSDSDRSWVVENLIPNLEKVNDIKICLHERDFQVGLSILENIVNGIDKSRSIILILSQAFVKSQWCQYEMHLAYHRLLETRRDRMILIFLENVPRFRRPKTLQYLMLTKTYLRWPGNLKNKKEIDLFWNRLFKALTHTNEI